jgi:hypothetical protein
LKASMEKCKQLKDDIRTLVNLTVSNFVSSKVVDAGSKKVDSSNYEAGLAFIGSVLQTGERKIALMWDMYEKTGQVADVTYPKDFTIKTDDERQTKVDALILDIQKIPSDTYKRELAKQIVYELFNGKVPDSKIKKIYNEIDEAITMTTDAPTIIADVEQGLVSLETASLARGYPKGEVEKAKKDHAERLALQVTAQSELTNKVDPNATLGNQARGNPDGQGDLKTSSKEKVGKAQRGQRKL